MKILVGGIIAVVPGVVGLIVWWTDFLQVLRGAIPILLLIDWWRLGDISRN